MQTDIMINNYNYSEDVRNWKRKHGDKKYNFTKKELKELIPNSMKNDKN